MANNKKSERHEPTTAPELPKDQAVDEPDDSSTDHKDVATDKAVDDIAVHESDELLEAEDTELKKAFEPKAEPHGLKAKLKHAIKAWWGNKKLRYASLAGVAVFLLLLFSVPPSRYFILNSSGVRGSASVMVLDNSTQQPLKNVEVTLAGQTAKTDSNGTVKLQHLKLGSTQLVINRRAFATVNKRITLGWGSNPLGNFNLTPTGTQYSFNVADFLSGKPIGQAEASTDQADAEADDQGHLVLTMDPSDTASVEVTITADTYRDVKLTLNLDDKSVHNVAMVPAQKHAFVSKRSGRYDLYTIDVDGNNEKLLLAGTGIERDSLSLLPQPSNNVVGYVSSRDNIRDKDGFLLDDLNIVDLKTGQATLVTRSQKIRQIDWIGSRIIFVQVAAGASAANPNREQLISYDVSNNSQKQLASSNYFNDVVVAGGVIYYAPSDGSDSNPPGLYKINADGSNKITVMPKTVWSIFRTSYDHLALSVGQDWYDLKLGNVTANKLSGPPSSQSQRVYEDDSDHKNSLWVDNRDGKGVLLKYDVLAQKDTTLRSQSGLNAPFYWLNDQYAVYRIHTDQETADYVVNVNGGQPRKINDVTNTSGLGQWYYYQ